MSATRGPRAVYLPGCVMRPAAIFVNEMCSVKITQQYGRLCKQLCAIFILTAGERDGINPLTPNDHYSGRTAPLTSKRCILYIYSTNTGTEYFKHCI